MIPRPALSQQITTALTRSRVVVLIGPRQCGKTTMARTFVPPDSLNYFDLEDPVSLARLDQPMTALRDLRGLVVIDEIQRRPNLFPILRVLVDRDPYQHGFSFSAARRPDCCANPPNRWLAGWKSLLWLGFAWPRWAWTL